MSRRALTPDDAMCRDVDLAYDGVVLLGRNDVVSLWSKKGVVGDEEALMWREVTRARELPHHLAGRVDDEETIVRALRDKRDRGKRGGLRPRSEVRSRDEVAG